MGIIKKKSEVLHLWAPGVKEKVVKKKKTFVPSDPVDDLWETGTLFNTGEYGALIIDTATVMSAAVLRSVVEKDTSSGHKGTNRVGFTTSGGVKIQHPTLQDYGVLASILEQFRVMTHPLTKVGKFIVWVGHEKLITKEDTDGNVLDTFGSLGFSGQMVMRNLPGLLTLLVRMGYRSAKGARKAKRTIIVEEDSTWRAKDRYGIFAEENVVVGVPRGKMSIEDHKEAIAERAAELWEPWLKEAQERDEGASLGIYGPPGCGKTLNVAGFAWALSEMTGQPCLYADWDSEGGASVPKALLEEGE